jgi:hypothetical protein
MNDLVSGIRVNHNLPRDVFCDRLTEAWRRVRFASPLVAAHINRGPRPTDLGQWVYTPVSLQGVDKWAKETLQFINVPSETGGVDEKCVEDRIRGLTQESLHNGQEDWPEDKRWQFYVQVLLEDGGRERAAIILHGSHTILDGPSGYHTRQIT